MGYQNKREREREERDLCVVNILCKSVEVKYGVVEIRLDGLKVSCLLA